MEHIIELSQDEAQNLNRVNQATDKKNKLNFPRWMRIEGDLIVAVNGYVVNAGPTPDALREHDGKLLMLSGRAKAGSNIVTLSSEKEEGFTYPDWRTCLNAAGKDQDQDIEIILDWQKLKQAVPSTSGKQLLKIRVRREYGPVTVQSTSGFSAVMPYYLGRNKDTWDWFAV